MPKPELFQTGTNPLRLIEELRGQGELQVRAQTEAIPSLEQLVPDECYLSWELELRTVRSQAEIEEVFCFVVDLCHLAVEPLVPVAPEVVRKESAIAAPSESGKPDASAAQDAHPMQQRRHDDHNSIRVHSEKLDQLINLVGELVTVQARLAQLANGRTDPELESVAEDVERLTWELRDSALTIRMVPLGSLFSRFKRLVHDLSHQLGKDIDLQLEGVETELDKMVIEKLNDPLVHLIRNSLDHGIETPDVRRAKGKQPRGTLHLWAGHAGTSVFIRVQDDGTGIDPERVRARAIERGLIAASSELTEAEIFNLILQPGFSTAPKITSVSGRGVGLDVVKKTLDALQGTIEITSKPNQGTTFTIRLPLTLAIIEGLLVNIESEAYVLPLSTVEECIELTQQDLDRSHGRQVINLRGAVVPFVRLKDYFSIPGEKQIIEQIVITSMGDHKVGFVVDRVVGEIQTVVKPLGRLYRDIVGLSGATILGDGRLALILDSVKLVQEAEAHREGA